MDRGSPAVLGGSAHWTPPSFSSALILPCSRLPQKAGFPDKILMVYQDLSRQYSSADKVLAPVQDRFLAFAFDAALCFPVLFVLLKPLWRKIQYLSITAVDSTELKVLLILGALFTVLLFVLFNAICLYKWGATPGKKIFQIRVISTNGAEKIGFSQAALRSFVWAWQVLCLGIPFMEVLSHHDRQPWHDRLGETMVLTRKKIRSDSPHWLEQHFFRNLYWALFAVIAITVGLEVRTLMVESFHGELKREELVKDGYLCSQLSDNLPTESTNRLDFGLGLYLIGQVNSECIENELDFALWAQDEEQMPWAYLARGFLSEAAGNPADQEFSKACPGDEGHPVVCAIAAWKKTGTVSELLKDTWLYKVAHLKELIKQGQFEELKAHINGNSWPSMLLSYAQSKGLQSLVVRGKTAAFEESYPLVTAAWDHEQRLEIGSWACLAQLTKNCKDKIESSACENLRTEVTNFSGRAWPRPVSLALARESECRGRNDKTSASQFARSFMKSQDTQWVQDLLEMKSIDDGSWNRVSKALKSLAQDDWLYAQGLFYLAEGAVTLDRQNYLQKIFAESGSEDLFWWLAKSEYATKIKGAPSLPLRVPTSTSEREK